MKKLLTVLILCIFVTLFSEIQIDIKPEFTALSEKVGIYFGYDGSTVSDKYSHTEKLQTFSITGSVSWKRLFLKWYYTDTEGFGLGSAKNDYQEYWYEANYKLISRSWYNVYLYHSNFKKDHSILEIVDYSASNSKFLVGFGVVSKETFGSSSMNFTNFSVGGAYGIIYSGFGSYKNDVWISPSNPYFPYYTDWTFEASESFGFVFFMDMGFIWSSRSYYAGAKMKVGGFLSGNSETNGFDNEGQMVNGTLFFQAVAGWKITEKINLGLDISAADENCRNESDENDGSRFYSTVFNIFLSLNMTL